MIPRKATVAILRTYQHVHSFLRKGTITLGPNTPKIGLTFDDGPDRRWTPKICKILAEYGARASFFMLGAQVEKDPEIAAAAAAAGHDICLHLYSHDRAVAKDERRFREELLRSVALIETLTGTTPRFLRFPFGYLGHQHPNRILDEFGIHTVHWSFSSLDSRSNAEQIARRVRRFLIPGSILLFHDGVGPFSKYSQNRDATVEVMPTILEECRSQNLSPVPLSELLQAPGLSRPTQEHNRKNDSIG
jgi:peptidoglycan/xylan/chitin deacetylase (PgdA/CDA1 family)